MASPEGTAASEQAVLTRPVLYAMAVASGIAVANIYYNQPMLGLIDQDFPGGHTSALIPTATQIGYALGLFFLLPLGDILRRRKLIIVQFIILAAALVVTAIAPSPLLLVVASLLLGASATVAQQIVPFAASLAPENKRGATIGTVMAGVLTGILFSRTLSGFVGDFAGWREMFWLGAPLALLGAILMVAVLPSHAPVSDVKYGAAIRSFVGYWRSHPRLRTAAIVQALLFASFSAFWTILALYLASPRFDLGSDIAGLFGVVGAVGIFAAPLAGKIADRQGPDRPIILGAILTVFAWLLFGVWGSLAALITGVILLDFGVQAALISNQHVIYALDPAARSRLNTLFMTAMFTGGAAGSALAAWAWRTGGWQFVSLLGAMLSIIAVGMKLLGHYQQRRRQETVCSEVQ
ncbi:MFS transporter [Martelella mediterranea]|uniref:Inner membrane transport protein YnfM n=1 Tax=Martelella mediterranea DSM 17316 TaxID=1122214 RepID=A0A1U9Z3N4_9HYPH|nr:MFS transporter [Martelella mediterranea]AQZ52212.1 Inner membrane transport protein YnfM [Martelella mediterranea DSM 17316]